MPVAAIAQAASGVIGGLISNAHNRAQAERNDRLQREYAQHGVQWKVEDAKRAGIHPIYALGAPTISYSPQSVGDSLGPAISNAGQSIGRAINSTSSPEQRGTAYQEAAQKLALEKGSLENEYLRSQIARMRIQQNPAIPTITQRYGTDGQGQTALPDPIAIKEKMERKNWNPANPSGEAFAIPDVGYSKTPGGGYFPVPSDEVKQRIEDNHWQELMHGFRNMVMPSLSTREQNPPYPAPEGTTWVFDPMRGYHLFDTVNKRYLHKSYGGR